MIGHSATIYPDGRMLLDGFVPEKWRLLAISSSQIVIHSPGGHWWDNGGRHYGEARIEVYEMISIERGNEEGTWRVRFKSSRTSGISFHPTPKRACLEAVHELVHRGDKLIEEVKRRSE